MLLCKHGNCLSLSHNTRYTCYLFFRDKMSGNDIFREIYTLQNTLTLILECYCNNFKLKILSGLTLKNLMNKIFTLLRSASLKSLNSSNKKAYNIQSWKNQKVKYAFICTASLMSRKLHELCIYWNVKQCIFQFKTF